MSVFEGQGRRRVRPLGVKAESKVDEMQSDITMQFLCFIYWLFTGLSYLSIVLLNAPST